MGNPGSNEFKMNYILIALLNLWAVTPEDYTCYNNVKKFDPYFSKYSKRFFGPGFDWRFFKAQAIAESRLEADAKSKVGAVGIMQIMPKTYKEIQKKNPMIKGSNLQPRWNISAGIYYNRQMWNAWKKKHTLQDKIDFMFGSYNAGRGNIIKAQTNAKSQGLNPHQWKSVEIMLPKVTGKHSQETIRYINKIKAIKRVLR